MTTNQRAALGAFAPSAVLGGMVWAANIAGDTARANPLGMVAALAIGGAVGFSLAWWAAAATTRAEATR